MLRTFNVISIIPAFFVYSSIVRFSENELRPQQRLRRAFHDRARKL